MKITKEELKRIIREEKTLLQESGLAHHGIFSEDYVYDLFASEVSDFLQTDGGAPFLTAVEQENIRRTVVAALQNIFDDFGETR